MCFFNFLGDNFVVFIIKLVIFLIWDKCFCLLLIVLIKDFLFCFIKGCVWCVFLYFEINFLVFVFKNIILMMMLFLFLILFIIVINELNSFLFFKLIVIVIFFKDGFFCFINFINLGNNIGGRLFI